MSGEVSELETLAFEAALTIDNTSGGIALPLAKRRGSTLRRIPTLVIITVEDAQIRWTDNGTVPTSSNGHLANPMSFIKLDNRERIEKFRAIRVTSTDATLQISFRG